MDGHAAFQAWQTPAYTLHTLPVPLPPRGVTAHLGYSGLHYGYFQGCFTCERTLRTCTPERKTTTTKNTSMDGHAQQTLAEAYSQLVSPLAPPNSSQVNIAGNRPPPRRQAPLWTREVRAHSVPIGGRGGGGGGSLSGPPSRVHCV